MTNRDPIAAAFDDYQRAPRDVVPHTAHTVDELRDLADGTTQAQITHYEMNKYGVTQHTEWATITQPFTHTREDREN